VENSYFLDISKLVAYEITKQDFNVSLDFDFTDGDAVISTPISFIGTISNNSSYISLNGTVRATFSARCSRCLKDITKTLSLPLSSPIATEPLSEENDEYIFAENGTVDLYEVAYSLIVLNMPTKYLCSDDCKGLCTRCGKDLNLGPCGCKKDIDPRLSGLSDFFK